MRVGGGLTWGEIILINSSLYFRQKRGFFWFEALFKAFVHNRLVALSLLLAALLLRVLLGFFRGWRRRSAEFALGS